eukprot:6909246-Lingulodinium_polyedra.AAC.1
MMAPRSPDDSETWIPHTLSPDTMPPFNPELAAPYPVDASRSAAQQVPDLDDDDDLLRCNN